MKLTFVTSFVPTVTFAATSAARVAITATGLVAMMAATAPSANAQDASQAMAPAATSQPQAAPSSAAKWSFLVTEGSVHPTGAQRQAIARGRATAAQLSYSVVPAFAVNTTLGWARSRDLSSLGDAKVDVFSYDIGAEVRTPVPPTGRGFAVRPFAGVGAGARSYNYRGAGLDSTHTGSAYVSGGAEVGMGRVRLRVEVRDYVTGLGFNRGGPSSTRNDVVVMTGLRFVKR